MNFFIVFVVLATFVTLSNGRPSTACTINTRINHNGEKKTRIRSESEERELRRIMLRMDIGIPFGVNTPSYLPFDTINEDTEMDVDFDMEMGMALSPIFEISNEKIPDETNINAANSSTTGMTLCN